MMSRAKETAPCALRPAFCFASRLLATLACDPADLAVQPGTPDDLAKQRGVVETAKWTKAPQ